MSDANTIRSRNRPRSQRFTVRTDCYIRSQPTFASLAREFINDEPVVYVESVEVDVWVPASVTSEQRALYLARKKGRQRAIELMRRKYDEYILTQNTEAFRVEHSPIRL